MTTQFQQHLTGAVRLTDWGLIRARGADTVGFLQSQLTQDIAALGAADARLAGYCSAKGRLLASFVVWQADAQTVLLACSADLLAATLKRLSMFVLRAKCRLDDASAELPLWGLAGDAAARLLPDSPPPPQAWQRTDAGGGTAIHLSDAAGQPRALWCAPPDRAPDVPALAPDAWAWLEARSGVPRITVATAEQFVPQMVNLELLDGVNFGKGCYPGQEVVARSQYRGTLKRRSFVFELDAMARPGQEVFHDRDPQQPAGLVVNAGSFEGRHAALVEVKLAALDAGALHLGAPDGPALRRVDMPYDVPVAADAA